jgi:myo-inositol-1(or 4)-monophosphatase
MTTDHRTDAPGDTTVDPDVLAAGSVPLDTIAREAGAMLRERFGDPGQIDAKGPLSDRTDGEVTALAFDLVTECDHASEKIILGRIQALNPAAVVLAEESGHVEAIVPAGAGGGSLAEADDLWIVDPLDGTVNFANSLPGFSVSIARYSRGVPVAGAIYDPLVDECFTFAAGEGARRNGVPIHVSSSERTHESVLGLGSSRGLFPNVTREFRTWRRVGSAALSLAYTASGRFGAHVTMGGLSPWDLAAGAPLIEHAGGLVVTTSFEDWSPVLEGTAGVVAAGTPTMLAEVQRLLALAED